MSSAGVTRCGVWGRPVSADPRLFLLWADEPGVSRPAEFVDPVMKLETASGSPCDFVTEADLVSLFARDWGSDEFAILAQEGEVYIQAAGEGDGPYVLEYRNGGADSHFECAPTLTKAEVESAFMKYFRDDRSWMTDHEWSRQDFGSDKPWWRSLLDLLGIKI